MVGPSLSDDRRRTLSTRLKLVFVTVVAVSGGSIAVQGGASLGIVALATVAGGIVGTALVWYLGVVVEQARRDGRTRGR